MKVNKKISLALLSVALLGAGTSLIESQDNSTSTVVQAAKKKSKAKSKTKTKKSTKSKKSKKTTKKSKKIKTVSTSKIYKALFGKKSNDSTLEKYRNSMTKAAKQYSDKIKKDPGSGYYLDLQATKNTHSYFIDYPETDGENPVLVKDSDKIKKGHSASVNAIDLFGTVADNTKNAPKANVSKTEVEKITGDDNYAIPNVGVKKLFGKYYYWIYDNTDSDANGEEFDLSCDFYPASDFKLVMKKS